MTLTNSQIVTLADAARSFAGSDLTRTQLKVIRARLRRHKITVQVNVIVNPTSGAEHYLVAVGSSVHVAIGERV